MGQFVQEGNKLLFETLLLVEKPQQDIIFPNDEENLDNRELEHTINPWNPEEGGSYNYTSNGGYLRGVLMTTNSYEENYQYRNYLGNKVEREDFTIVVTDKYQSNKLVSINHLKTPYTLHSGSSTSKARFVNLPFISAIENNGGGTIHVPNCSNTKKSEEKIKTTTF
jgi:hypothetical protein